MGGGKSQQKVDLKEVKEKQALQRSQLLRGANVFLTEGAFRQRKAYLTAKAGFSSSCCAIRTLRHASTIHCLLSHRLNSFEAFSDSEACRTMHCPIVTLTCSIAHAGSRTLKGRPVPLRIQGDAHSKA